MIVKAIQNGRNNNQRNQQLVRSVRNGKNVSKTGVAENTYELLQQKALLAYQR